MPAPIDLSLCSFLSRKNKLLPSLCFYSSPQRASKPAAPASISTREPSQIHEHLVLLCHHNDDLKHRKRNATAAPPECCRARRAGAPAPTPPQPRRRPRPREHHDAEHQEEEMQPHQLDGDNAARRERMKEPAVAKLLERRPAPLEFAWGFPLFAPSRCTRRGGRRKEEGPSASRRRAPPPGAPSSDRSRSRTPRRARAASPRHSATVFLLRLVVLKPHGSSEDPDYFDYLDDVDYAEVKR